MKYNLERIKKTLSEKKLSKGTYQDVIENCIQGKCMQEQLGISDSLMQEFYNVSLSYLEEKLYKEASDCFLFLIALNPLESNLWIKAGNASYGAHAYDEALESYSMAMFCDADDPFPHLYSSQIYLERGELEKAKECREIVLRLIEGNSRYIPLKNLLGVA